MNNISIKETFIKDYNNGMSQVYIRNIFNKSEELENKLGIDVSEFSISQIGELLQYFKSTSTESLRVKVCMLRNYTNYMMSQGLIKIDTNNYNSVTTELLENSVDQDFVKEKYISREKLMEYIQELPNVCDQFVLMALHEGIKGDKLSEITMTSGKDINERKNVINFFGGRSLVCSSKLIDIAVESSETYTYESLYENSMRELTLIGDRILKVRDNVTQDDMIHAYKRMLKRINAIKNYLGVNTISITGLLISGFVYNIKLLSEKKEMGLDELIDTKEFKELAKRYNYDKYVYSRLKVIIKDYLVSN